MGVENALGGFIVTNTFSGSGVRFVVRNRSQCNSLVVPGFRARRRTRCGALARVRGTGSAPEGTPDAEARHRPKPGERGLFPLVAPREDIGRYFVGERRILDERTARYPLRSTVEEVLAGITVAIALLPAAASCALATGVPPLAGIVSTGLLCAITAALGGRPGMISGTSAALIILQAPLYQQYGAAAVAAAVVLSGILQLLFGIYRLGKFVRLISYPTFLGFISGIAILTATSQVYAFQLPAGTGLSPGAPWLQGNMLRAALIVAALAAGVAHVWPLIIQRLERRRPDSTHRWQHRLAELLRWLPSPLAGILVASIYAEVTQAPVRRLGDFLRDTLAQSGAIGVSWAALPSTPLAWMAILSTALGLAFIGLLESLLTMTLVDEVTESRGSTRRECLALGAGNIAAGLFGGVGGCGLLGQSLLNTKSGGRGRLSGLTAALCLLVLARNPSGLMIRIPVPAIASLMVLVALGSFEWASLRLFRAIPLADSLTIVSVALMTVATRNVALAVLFGVVFSALVFAYKASRRITAQSFISEDEQTRGWRGYRIDGPLFFGTAERFSRLFDPARDRAEGHEHVIIDFSGSRIWDATALEALDSLARQYRSYGIRLHLWGLSRDSARLLREARAYIDESVTNENALYLYERVVADYPTNDSLEVEYELFAKRESGNAA
jgi:SulP family sulfate permease